MRSSFRATERFIEIISDDMMSGRSTLINIPTYPHLELRSGLRRRLLSEDFGKELKFVSDSQQDQNGHIPPEELLCIAFQIDPGLGVSDCVSALVKEEEFLGAPIWVEIDHIESIPDWCSFACVLQTQLESFNIWDRTSLCIVYKGRLDPKVMSSDSGLAVRQWKGAVSPLDIEIILDELLGSDTGLTESVRLATIKELAGFDWCLADYLARYSLDEIMAPLTILNDYWGRTGISSDNEPRWDEGTLDIFRGRDFVHSSVLARTADGEQELAMRVWQAQVKLLYPYLVELRFAILNQFRDSFEKGFNVVNWDPNNLYSPECVDDLEIGQLALVASVYRGFSTSLRGTLQLIRYVRNELAHCRAISSDYLGRLELAGQRFLLAHR